MKPTSYFLMTVLAAASLTFLINCSDKKNGEAKDPDSKKGVSAADQQASEPRFDVDESFQGQLADVFMSYIDIKNALVSSDAARVKNEAAETEIALAKVDMKLVSGVAHNDWMTYLTPIQSSLDEIQASGNIEAQRKAFSTLSDGLYNSIKAFGLGGEEAFYEYCPMAFNNEGAYWLSENDEIVNPYFGDKMLKCGEVREKLQ